MHQSCQRPSRASKWAIDWLHNTRSSHVRCSRILDRPKALVGKGRRPDDPSPDSAKNEETSCRALHVSVVGGHDHAHGHSHEHPHVQRATADRLTLGGLVGLGLMHGIVPTTDALAVLLVALSVKQTTLGVLLILSYSLGIARVLSGVGVLFLTSQGLMQRFTRLAALSRWGPAIAAATVSLLGLAMIARTIGV